MSTYYEILNIPSTATVSEIEAAYEAQYNHWRRLVTHHDPEKASQANQMLLRLEEARATLADAAKREQYDASIGLLGPVGGLADPHAAPQTATRTPPSSPRGTPAGAPPPAASGTDERVDAWICPQCQMANAPQSTFCKKCGHAIGLACPNCDNVVEAAAEFCTVCGANIPKAMRCQEVRTQIAAKEKELAEAERATSEQDQSTRGLEKATVAAGAWMGTELTWAFLFVRLWALASENISEGSFSTMSWVCFGVLLLSTLALISARGAVGTSAVLAIISGLITAGPIDNLPLGHIELFAALGVLAAWGLGFTLGRHGRWIWTWVAWFTLSAAGEWLMVPSLGKGSMLLEIAFSLLQALSFGLMGMQAWRVTHQIERQRAMAMDETRKRVERLRHEIDQLSHGLSASKKR